MVNTLLINKANSEFRVVCPKQTCGLLHTVCPLVVVKCGALTEGFPTLDTLVRLLASVNSLVHNQL